MKGLRFVPDLSDPAGTEVVRSGVADSLSVIEDMWPFRRPRWASVVVWTSWMQGYTDGLRWWQRAALPLVRKRAEALGERLWPLVGGVTLRAQPPAVLIKPPRLLAEADVRLGEKLFVRIEDIDERVRAIACHEMVHAYANGRALPPWLNEGIAMLTVDRFFGYPTVKPQTIEMLGAVDRPLRTYLRLPKLTDSELVKLYARGYWVCRYLDEQHPKVLRKLVGPRLGLGVGERHLAKALGVPRRQLWQAIDGIVFDHFHG